MSEKSTAQIDALARDIAASAANPMFTSDMVLESAPSFSVATLMISAAQSQSRAMESGVAQLNHTYLAGLATATQCVSRILEDPARSALLKALIVSENQ